MHQGEKCLKSGADNLTPAGKKVESDRKKQWMEERGEKVGELKEMG